MYIVEVTPIEKGLPMPSLTYYSKAGVTIGDLVEINVNNRKGVHALVLSVDDLANQKANIKAKDWNTKKIENIVIKGCIEKELLISICETAIEYILPIPTLLALLFEKKFLAAPHDARAHLEKKFAKMKPHSLHNYNPHVERDMYRVLQNILIQILPPPNGARANPSFHSLRGRTCTPMNSHFPPPLEGGVGGGGCVGGNNLHIIRDEFKYITPLISVVTDKLIRNVLDNIYDGGNAKLLIYTYRKGEAPLSRCYDCGQDVLCPDCHMPLVLHKQTSGHKTEDTNGNKYYLCHHCGYRQNLNFIKKETSNTTKVNPNAPLLEAQIANLEMENNMYRCKHCDSWRVMPLGISTGSVVHNILETYKELSDLIYQIDGDTTTTKTQIKNVLKVWNERGGILVANDKIFSLATTCQADYSIIISIDGLFTMPIANIDERVLTLINSIAEMTRKDIMLHTHLHNLPLFKALSISDEGERSLAVQNLLNSNLEKLELAKLYPFYHNISTAYSESLDEALHKEDIPFIIFKKYNKEYININYKIENSAASNAFKYKVYNILLSQRKYSEIMID